jgi:hypothetical protein
MASGALSMNSIPRRPALNRVHIYKRLPPKSNISRYQCCGNPRARWGYSLGCIVLAHVSAILRVYSFDLVILVAAQICNAMQCTARQGKNWFCSLAGLLRILGRGAAESTTPSAPPKDPGPGLVSD